MKQHYTLPVKPLATDNHIGQRRIAFTKHTDRRPMSRLCAIICVQYSTKGSSGDLTCPQRRNGLISRLPAPRPLVIRILLVCVLGLAVRPAAAAPAPSELPDDLTPIYLIQGDGPSTPLPQKRVTTFGLVSGVQSNGFYLQDPTGDGDPQSSDGIFVYTSSAPRVNAGECILVGGAEATEYYEKTELTTPRSLKKLSIDLCGDGSLPAPLAPLPAPNVDPEALLERFEGMLVAFEELQGVVQGPTKRFSNGNVEIALIAEQALPFVRGGRVFQSNPDDAAGLIFLGNGLGAELPPAAWGDLVRVRAAEPGTPVLAVIDYSFGKYLLLLLPGQEIEVLSRHGSNDETAQSDAGAFRVCSFNVLGLGRGLDQLRNATDYEAALRQRAEAIAGGLQNCEIVGLQETGKPEDAENLARVLTEISGLDYSAVAFAGPGTASPSFPLTNSLLVRDDRVTVLNAENVQACTRFSFSVRLVPGQCPARLLPLFSRPPLVTDLLVRGPWGEDYPLTVVVNHWRSKRGDESVNVVHRTLQAEHVASIVQARLDTDPDAHVVVLGDLNDFEMSKPVETLRYGPEDADGAAREPGHILLWHAFDALPLQDRYTYIFNGGSQTLDHLLLTPGMMPDFGGMDIAHINADFPITQPGGIEGVPGLSPAFGSSDHDPLVLTVRPGGGAWIAGNAQIPNTLVELADSSGTVIARTQSDALGEFRFFDLRPGAYSLRFALPAHVTLLPAEDSDGSSAAVIPVEVAPGRATVVELSARDRRAEAGAASALFSIYYGSESAEHARTSDP